MSIILSVVAIAGRTIKVAERVVTKDVPLYVCVAVNPVRIIRELTPEERRQQKIII